MNKSYHVTKWGVHTESESQYITKWYQNTENRGCIMINRAISIQNTYLIM